MKNCNLVSVRESLSYVDAYGELHIPERVCELIEKAKSNGCGIRNFKMGGHFSGIVIASDLTIRL